MRKVVDKESHKRIKNNDLCNSVVDYSVNITCSILEGF